MQNKIIIKIFIILIIILIIPINIYSDELEDLFIKAQNLYDKAIGLKSIKQNTDIVNQLFEESASIYQKLINEHKSQNAYLYYNLGNCYYQIGEIGNAIFNYKIAQQLNPSFLDIRKNLTEARILVKGYIEDKSRDSFLKVLFFWHFQLNTNLKLWIGIIAFILIWLIAFFNLLFRKRFLVVLLIIVSIIAGIFLISVTVQYLSENNQWWGVITNTDGTDAKKGPGEEYESSFKQNLSEGIEFTILEEDNSWLKIKLLNNELCWVPQTGIKTVKGSVLFK